MIAETVCGQTIFLCDHKGMTCALPKKNAVLCGRCHGEEATFGKHSKKGITRREAKLRIGCAAEGE